MLGVLTLPFAVALYTKADLGLSMIAAPTYIISEKVSWLSYGQTEYIVQALVLALMCIAVGKFKWAYLTSFVTALLYGSVLDLYIWLMRGWTPGAMWVRVLIFAAGMVFTAVGVSMFLHTYLAPCSYDYFVRTVVQEKNLDLRKFKLGNDAVYLVVSVVLSLALFHGFVGVTWGTLVIVLCNGHLITAISNRMDRDIEFFDRFPKLAKYF